MKHSKRLLNWVAVGGLIGSVLLQRSSEPIGSLIGAASVSSEAVSQSKKWADYWREAGLQERELLSLISDELCFSDKKIFLACVHSIQSAADRQKKLLGVNLRLRQTPGHQPLFWNEKQELNYWNHLYEWNSWQPRGQFLQAWSELKQQASKKEQALLLASAFNGYLSIARDPHSYLMPRAYYEQVVAASQSQQLPLGMTWRRSDAGLLVRKVYPGSPAAEAGLFPGDLITAIDGKRSTAYWNTELQDLLREPPVLGLRLAVQRQGSSIPLVLIPSARSYASVSSEIFVEKSSQVLVVSVHRFVQGTCRMIEKEILASRVHSLRGIFLDLRDNPGGQVAEAACALGLFVARGTPLFEMRFLEADRKTELYRASGGFLYAGPLVVLVNAGTASAAEIMAGSLQDLGRARVVGQRTFGKGTFQDGRPWQDSSDLVFFQTGGMYFFPSGWTSQIEGIQPDREIGPRDPLPREGDLYWRPLPVLAQAKGPRGLRPLHCLESNRLSGDLLESMESWKAPLEEKKKGLEQILTEAIEVLRCLPSVLE